MQFLSPCDTKACAVAVLVLGRSVEPGWYFQIEEIHCLYIADFCRRPYRRRQENMEYERQVRDNGCRGQLSSCNYRFTKPDRKTDKNGKGLDYMNREIFWNYR